jgi:hypothetical protein
LLLFYSLTKIIVGFVFRMVKISWVRVQSVEIFFKKKYVSFTNKCDRVFCYELCHFWSNYEHVNSDHIVGHSVFFGRVLCTLKFVLRTSVASAQINNFVHLNEFIMKLFKLLHHEIVPKFPFCALHFVFELNVQKLVISVLKIGNLDCQEHVHVVLDCVFCKSSFCP